MISTRSTSDVWKAYLFAADVIAARYSEYLHRRKATAACMGPANTASPGTIEYDPKTTTMRARMGAHPEDQRSRLRTLHFHEQVLVCQAVWVLNRHKRNNGSYT